MSPCQSSFPAECTGADWWIFLAIFQDACRNYQDVSKTHVTKAIDNWWSSSFFATGKVTSGLSYPALLPGQGKQPQALKSPTTTRTCLTDPRQQRDPYRTQGGVNYAQWHSAPPPSLFVRKQNEGRQGRLMERQPHTEYQFPAHFQQPPSLNGYPLFLFTGLLLTWQPIGQYPCFRASLLINGGQTTYSDVFIKFFCSTRFNSSQPDVVKGFTVTHTHEIQKTPACKNTPQIKLDRHGITYCYALM